MTAFTNHIVLPFSVPSPGAPLIDPTKASPVFVPGVEAGAARHWLFGTDSSSLTDLIAGAALTPVAGHLPSYAAGSLTTPDGGAYGLKSNMVDSNTMTICVIAQYRASVGSVGTVLIGTQQTSAFSGFSVYFSPTNSDLTFRTLGYAANDVVSVPAQVANGDWLFIAISQSPTARIGFCGSGGNATRSGTKTVSSNNVGLANAWPSQAAYQNGSGKAEAIIFSSALTLAQLQDIYVRSKARMSARGIYIR